MEIAQILKILDYGGKNQLVQLGYSPLVLTPGQQHIIQPVQSQVGCVDGGQQAGLGVVHQVAALHTAARARAIHIPQHRVGPQRTRVLHRQPENVIQIRKARLHRHTSCRNACRHRRIGARRFTSETR